MVRLSKTQRAATGRHQSLRAILKNIIYFSNFCRTGPPQLFVCATNVQSGRAKVFHAEEISVEALLASACLPFLYQAVRINGQGYWDGDYTGNPPLWPLIYHCKTLDIVVVQINPIERFETPTDSQSIQNRVNEISFNSNLMGEMRAIVLSAQGKRRRIATNGCGSIRSKMWTPCAH
jgi:NTE family protein